MTSWPACALLSVEPSDHGRRYEKTSNTSEIPVDILVEQEIQAEIEELRARQRHADDLAFDLVGQRDDLRKTWETLREPTEEEEAKEESLTRQIVKAVNAGVNLGSMIHNLDSPGEHERRVNKKLADQQSIRRLRMSEEQTKAKAPTPKEQGVPAQYLNEDGSRFKTGMDARLKSDLVLSVTGEITTADPGNSLHVFTEAEARKILEARGWNSFLERKQQILAEKAAKKVESDAKREAAARERAEAKAKKDAEKAQEKEAKAAEAAAAKQTADEAAKAKEAGQAAPDPKPTRSSSRAKAGASK